MDIPQCFYGFGGIILLIALLYAGFRVWNRLTHPVVRKAAQAANTLRVYRVAASRLPEGQLIDVNDRSVRERGEAMLLEGVPTREINAALIQMTADQLEDSLHPEWLFGREVRRDIPGYTNAAPEKDKPLRFS